MEHQHYRQQQLRDLTDSIGVYALCDLDEVPIYVGQSTDGIRSRVRRHLTSARSDVIANRQIDVWEVAFVWAWPVPRSDVDTVEAKLFHDFDTASKLMNGEVPNHPTEEVKIPDRVTVRVLPEAEQSRRKEPRYRFPRQAQQVASLLDYILEVNDKSHLRRSLHAHFERLHRYYRSFQGDLMQTFDGTS